MGEVGGATSLLDEESWRAHLAPLLARRPAGLVLAVSGGPDSVAMMRLTAALAQRQILPPVAVATVDHGLRAGSGADADFVIAQAATIGWSAHRLLWTGPKPNRALQEKARAARYALLVELCVRTGADHLVTAHTRDDQAETILLRMARGSGPAGLQGMQEFSRLTCGVSQARPLLAVPKAHLVATCAARGWPTVHDPSNDDARFARTRLRHLLPALAAEGLDARGFTRLAGRLEQAEAAIVYATDQVARTAVRMNGPQLWQIDMVALLPLPPEFATRLVGRAIRVGGVTHRVRLDRLERAAEACRRAVAEGSALTRTLHGCLLSLSASGILSIRREGPRRRGSAASDEGAPRPAATRVQHERSASLGKGGRHPYIAE